MNIKLTLVFMLSAMTIQPIMLATGETKEVQKKKNSWIADGYKKDFMATLTGNILSSVFLCKKTTASLVTCVIGTIFGGLCARECYRNLTPSGNLYQIGLDLEKIKTSSVFKAVKENGNLDEAYKYEYHYNVSVNQNVSDRLEYLTKTLMKNERNLEWVKARINDQDLIQEIEAELTDIRQDIKDLQNK